MQFVALSTIFVYCTTNIHFIIANSHLNTIFYVGDRSFAWKKIVTAAIIYLEKEFPNLLF